MLNLFFDLFRQTQNSIISKFFFNVIKNTQICGNCQTTYYYTYNSMLKFKIDDYRKYRDQAYPQKTCMNLNMDECFQCFVGGYNTQCNFCQNNNAKCSKIISNPANVLIIAFQRNIHNYNCDVDFPLKMNINKYIALEHLSGFNSNSSYILKACISLNNNKQYFSDICINNYWFRFAINNIISLGNVENDIHVFEPQLLIYELEAVQNNQMQQMMMMKQFQMIQLQNIGAQNLMLKMNNILNMNNYNQ